MGIEKPHRFRARPQTFIQRHRFTPSKSGLQHQPDPEITINLEKLRDLLNSLESFSEG